MELRQLTYFVAVAEELGFTRAAARLGIAQPPLSQSIAKLERQLGVRLFDRTSRRITLTGAGRVLLREARDVLRRVDETTRVVSRSGDLEVLPVRIGSVHSALSGILPDAIPRFRERHPAGFPLVYEVEPHEQLELLRRGTLDVGLNRVRGPVEGLEVTPLPDEPLVAALPADHPLTRSRSVRLTRLVDEDFVLFPRSIAPTAYDAITAACATAGFSPRVIQEVGDDQALLSLVACGMGISLVPRSTTALRMRRVAYRRLAEPHAVTPLALVLPAGGGSTGGQAFRDSLRTDALQLWE